MLRQAPRLLARYHAPASRSLPQRRLHTTAAPIQTSRSWKNSAARWTIALGLIYWYNTNNLFAEEAAFPVSQPLSPTEEITLPTVDDIARTRQRQKQRREQTDDRSLPLPPSESSTTASPALSETEEEASNEGAYNEETGEINWDCPCLGGMAHGPCGEQFKAAFSCFVYSKEEPKGMECIDHFKGMQDCFREHPDIYGDEMEAEERDVEEELRGRGKEGVALARGGEGHVAGGEEKGAVIGEEGAEGGLVGKSASGHEEGKEQGFHTSPVGGETKGETKSPGGGSATQRAQAAKEQVSRDHGEPSSESEAAVPKASHDAR